ncbi:MAG: sterol desaturase family protein [bacterium]|nr:sterol desaturase family protein [bacterium]
MSEWLLSQELAVRLGFFFGVFILVALAEAAFPRRKRQYSRKLRWYANIGIVFLNSAIARLVLPILPMVLAATAVERGWGLFNILSVPYWFALIASVVLLDFFIYLQHVMVHAVPLLWRLHRMHHTDLDYDVTTGARFHPIEILLSLVIKLALVLVLGPPVVAVLAFEVILNAMAMFNHGNLKLPLGLDRWLRWVVITPDFHRVHHSTDPKETNRNFGFNLSWWDRLLGTYKAQPALGHEGMEIGIDKFREAKYLHLHQLLMQPFYPEGQFYAFNDLPQKDQ